MPVFDTPIVTPFLEVSTIFKVYQVQTHKSTNHLYLTQWHQRRLKWEKTTWTTMEERWRLHDAKRSHGFWSGKLVQLFHFPNLTLHILKRNDNVLYLYCNQCMHCLYKGVLITLCLMRLPDVYQVSWYPASYAKWITMKTGWTRTPNKKFQQYSKHLIPLPHSQYLTPLPCI